MISFSYIDNNAKNVHFWLFGGGGGGLNGLSIIRPGSSGFPVITLTMKYADVAAA